MNSNVAFCLNTTQFVFEGIYYKQVFGTEMGSLLSAVIANLVMEHIEYRALTTAPVILNELILTNICHLTRHICHLIIREAIKSLLLQLCFREWRI